MRRTAMALVMAALAAGVATAPAAPPAGAEDPVPMVSTTTVVDGGDDVEELPHGYPLLTSTDLELVDADEGAGQVVGLRFTGLGLPRGATITEAWVQFTADETQVDPASLTLAAHAADDAPPFTTGNRNVSTRPRTAATVTWAPDPWTSVGAADASTRTPDLSPLIQELVDRTGWTEASALALVITGTGHRTAVAFEASPAQAPSLQVAWLPPPPPDPELLVVDRRVDAVADDAEEFATGVVTRSSGDLELVDDTGVLQTVGVRFRDLGIPRGARIERAWIQFTADEVQDEPTDLVIAAHDVDNAASFGPNNENVSGRPRTSTVAWSPPPWTSVTEAGPGQRTPDLAPIVQEVVDRPYWWTGSALGFTITGTGHRTAVAFDGAPGRAPALHLEYRLGPPAPHEPPVSRFAAVGDFGNGGWGEGRVANLIHRLDVDAVLAAGDNSYGPAPIDDNIGRHFQNWIGGYRGAYGTGAEVNRFFPVLGNHDYSDGGGLAAYLDYFALPGVGIAGSGRTTHERYYDVVLGPVHVFALNSNGQEPDGITADSAQAQWLRDGLAASTSPWQIVMLHHSPFSSGSHGSAPVLQWPFAAWGVDAVISGHDHDYERLEADGIPYVVTGLGGVSRYPLNVLDPHSQIFYDGNDGALLIEACPGRLDLSFHNVAGVVIDTRRVGGPTCEPPVVTAEATDPVAAEPGPDTGTVTLRRTGAAERALDVRYTAGGMATAGGDYTALSGTATFAPGATETTVPVTAVDDPAVEDDESVELTLVDGPAYDLGSPASATVTVRSEDRPPVNRDLHVETESRVSGWAVWGAVASMRTSNNERHNFREAVVNNTSQLEYRWTFTVPANLRLQLLVEAHHSANTEGDDFAVQWNDNGTWRTMLTVRKLLDNGTTQWGTFPDGTSGTVTVRVRDVDRTPGRTELDIVSFDRLHLRALVPA